MPYVNIPDSNLSSNLAKLIGGVQADLKTKAVSSAESLAQELESEDLCNNPSRLSQIAAAKNNLNSSTNKFNSRLSTIKRVVRPLKRAVTAFRRVIRVLENIPIPQSVPPGFGIPINVTVKFVKLLEIAKEFQKQFNDDVDAVERLTAEGSDVASDLDSIQRSLRTIDQRLQRCDEIRRRKEFEDSRRNNLKQQVQNLNDLNSNFSDSELILTNVGEIFLRPGQQLPDGIFPLVSERRRGTVGENDIDREFNLTDPVEESTIAGVNITQESTKIRSANEDENISRAGLTGEEALQSSNIADSDTFNSINNLDTELTQEIYTASNGVQYLLEVFTDLSRTIAPLRFGRAQEKLSRRIVITGEKSYSSSTEILIEELKFRIENELT